MSAAAADQAPATRAPKRRRAAGEEEEETLSPPEPRDRQLELAVAFFSLHYVVDPLIPRRDGTDMTTVLHALNHGLFHALRLPPWTATEFYRRFLPRAREIVGPGACPPSGGAQNWQVRRLYLGADFVLWRAAVRLWLSGVSGDQFRLGFDRLRAARATTMTPEWWQSR